MKKLLKITSWAVVIFVILSIAGGAYMLKYSLTNKYHEGYSLCGELDSMAVRNPEISVWLDSIRHTGELRDTFIVTKDNVRLHALYVNAPSESSRTALLLHGYTDDATMMLNIGHLYNTTLNTNIFIPDFRAHGLSEGGDIVGMGWKDLKDIYEWFPVITDLYSDTTQIVVHGVSMGASTALVLSGNEPETYTRNIKCYIEDCGYTSVWDEFKSELKKQFSLPPFPLLYVASGMSKIFNGWSFGEASALNAVADSEKPILFIHGDADTYVPTEMVYRLYEAAKCEKELWITEGVTHAKSYRNNPIKYAEHVDEFVGKYTSK